MKKIKIYLVFVFIAIIFSNCVEDEMPNSAPVIEMPAISISSPEDDDDVTVSVKITDNSSIQSVKLFYFINDENASEIVMSDAGNDIYEGIIPKQINFTVVSYYIEAVDNENKNTIYPADAPNTKLSYTVGENAVLIYINEVICKDEDEPYFTDEEGGGTDWIEIYNGGLNPVDIGGMYITDNPNDAIADCEQIPNTNASVTTIQSGEYLVLIVGAKDSSGNDLSTQIFDNKIFIDMGLKASGEDNVILYNENENLIDQSGDILNELEDEKSYGRTTNGGASWQVFDNPTPGISNE